MLNVLLLTQNHNHFKMNCKIVLQTISNLMLTNCLQNNFNLCFCPTSLFNSNVCHLRERDCICCSTVLYFSEYNEARHISCKCKHLNNIAVTDWGIFPSCLTWNIFLLCCFMLNVVSPHNKWHESDYRLTSSSITHDECFSVILALSPVSCFTSLLSVSKRNHCNGHMRWCLRWTRLTATPSCCRGFSWATVSWTAVISTPGACEGQCPWCQGGTSDVKLQRFITSNVILTTNLNLIFT